MNERDSDVNGRLQNSVDPMQPDEMDPEQHLKAQPNDHSETTRCPEMARTAISEGGVPLRCRGAQLKWLAD